MRIASDSTLSTRYSALFSEENTMNAVLALKKNVYVQVPATIVTISLMIALPFLVHLAPPVGGIQMGAIMLPIFYAPLVAIFLFHPAVSIVAAMLAPTINLLVTGR